ncbi:MAG: cytochrome c oxidase accessory protein CcoG [Methylocystis sp.]|nr:cytochrome c oxidase accessory protein CcoG [Methylocystis sp.]MCA3585064.1 cytochrome c oxidase accessory protein CcoG [Methylocystis sp.]MCA3587781.1 cytochrome c oxidase accessory protein CcoG [Methylocystis sp.]MCA3592282.1 cytochrome c oxidase accessory protein CcoG [Methylocystis sp.]
MSTPEVQAEIPFFAPSPKVYPQQVSGRFRRIKWVILFVTLGIYYFLPFVRWDRGPNLPDQAVLVDFERRRFYFFFIEIWPQEVYYFTGLLIMAAVTLFLLNAVAGRLWCGYTCPQTVWSDLFLQVERLVEGDRRDRIKRDEGPWDTNVWRLKITKHFLWLMIAWWTGGAWVLYFSDAPTLVYQLATGTAPFAAYLWIAILTFTTYVFAGHLREQVCLYMCPWPRIQAALTDEHALNVSYRFDRGEPRMSLKEARKHEAIDEKAGDCIDCHQCVAVCPTGVDIREGSQLGCIQCGLCIDACDSVMAKVDRPAGLIGYDTDDNIKARALGQPTHYRIVRPRTIVYALLLFVVGGAMIFQLATRATASISVLHERNPMFVVLSDGSIRNAYTVRIANKRPESRPFALSVEGPVGTQIEAVGVAPTSDWRPVVEVGPDQTREVRVLVTMPRGIISEKSTLISIKAADLFAGENVAAKENFFAP